MAIMERTLRRASETYAIAPALAQDARLPRLASIYAYRAVWGKYGAKTAVAGVVTLVLVALLNKPHSARPVIHKLGTVAPGIMETTPFVFNNRLYRLDSMRPCKRDEHFQSYFRIVDVESGQIVSRFAYGFYFGCAYVENGTVSVYGTDKSGGSKICRFESSDLKTWTHQNVLSLPGWSIFNTSVCRAQDGYVMAIEIDKPARESGVPFTIRFATSPDLKHWTLTPSQCIFGKDRYTACPTVRYSDGWFYMFYLEQIGRHYETYLTRSRDLMNWQPCPSNPILKQSAGDKINGPQDARDINNSDMDLVEFKSVTRIYYSWGNQNYNDFLATAEYRGSLAEFLQRSYVN